MELFAASATAEFLIGDMPRRDEELIVIQAASTPLFLGLNGKHAY